MTMKNTVTQSVYCITYPVADQCVVAAAAKCPVEVVMPQVEAVQSLEVACSSVVAEVQISARR